MYITRFVRADSKGNEDYYYNELKDAEYHFSLFLDDDTGLYRAIEIIFLDGNKEELIKSNLCA